MEVNGCHQLFGYKLSLNYLVCVCVFKRRKATINGTHEGDDRMFLFLLNYPFKNVFSYFALL